MKNSEIICLFFKFISLIIYLTRQISCVDCQENKRKHRPNMSHKSEGEKNAKNSSMEQQIKLHHDCISKVCNASYLETRPLGQSTLTAA